MLYLVPTLLGAEAMSDEPAAGGAGDVCSLDGFIAENAKSARQFLKAVGIRCPCVEVCIAELNEHTPPAALPDSACAGASRASASACCPRRDVLPSPIPALRWSRWRIERAYEWCRWSGPPPCCSRLMAPA